MLVFCIHCDSMWIFLLCGFPPKNTFPSEQRGPHKQTHSQYQLDYSVDLKAAGEAELPNHRWIKLHVANRWVFSKQLRLHNYSSNSFLAAETFLPSTAKAQNELCK